MIGGARELRERRGFATVETSSAARDHFDHAPSSPRRQSPSRSTVPRGSRMPISSPFDEPRPQPALLAQLERQHQSLDARLPLRRDARGIAQFADDQLADDRIA